MKKRYKHMTASLISLLSIISLTGCSSLMSSKMPSGSISMEQAYHNAINGVIDNTGADDTLQQMRDKVNALKERATHYIDDTQSQKNDISSPFPRLPNPTIVMYVYPHEAGTGDNVVPVPGYSTVFPLYEHVYYAMPDEVNAI